MAHVGRARGRRCTSSWSLPRCRQRNPEARAEALSQLAELDVLGATLRAAMTRQALRHHFES